MMKPTDILMQEHRVIEVVLDCLEGIVGEAISQGRLDQDAAGQALDFFKMFADTCHHGKEEVHLFPMMEAKGFHRENGPTGQMLLEHEEGRAHIQGMREALEQAGAGDKEALMQFARHANAYVRLLRDHISKEDHCLFPMANQAMSEADQQDLASRFHHVESQEMGEGTHERYLTIAEALAAKYNVEGSAVLAAAGTCACHHHSH
ncbi:MAG: hemerythrin [Candidatus Omnitrophica bacterium]|nr:hemerythrin [Candidatus Omnitrophota bacterium]